MPIYFFHWRYGDETVRDMEGCELPDPVAIAARALRDARGMICRDALIGRIRLGQRIDVEDDEDRLVHRLTFRDAIRIFREEGAAAEDRAVVLTGFAP